MTPGARLQAAIELLDEVEVTPRPADAVISAFFRARRFIGAKDRAAVAETVYGVLRRHARLRWWFTQSVRNGTPTQWQAQRIMLDAIAPLLDPVPVAGEVVFWPDFAHKTLEDLYDEACWTTVNGVTGLRAYVRGSSAV